MKNIVLIAAAAAVGLVSTASQAAPETFNGTASVVILEQLAITQNTALSFGTVDLAKTGTSSFTVDPSPSVSPSVTGTGASFVAPPVAGAFTVTGSNLPVTLSENEGTCGSGVTLTNLSLSAASVTLVGGSASFTLGGTVNIAAGTAAGTVNCSYTLTAQYS